MNRLITSQSRALKRGIYGNNYFSHHRPDRRRRPHQLRTRPVGPGESVACRKAAPMIAGTAITTLLNGAFFAPGMVGQGFGFNGNNQCVQIPYVPSLVNSNYSVEAWVKPLAQVSDFINQDLIFGQSYGQCQLLARTGTTGVRVAFAFGPASYLL